MVNIVSGFADAGPIWAVNYTNESVENVMDCREPMSMVNWEVIALWVMDSITERVCGFGVECIHEAINC